MSGRKLIVIMTMLLGPSVPMALAQHEHGEEHGKPTEFKMPATYKDGVAEIKHRLHEIEELMDAKDLDKVHAQAEIIQKVGNVIGQLALKADSGVPRDAVKEVNRAGRELAAKFDAIDKAGDSGDLAGTRKVYDEMCKLCTTLEKHVPKVYACTMKCEGDKTYSQPGKCPKCGMALAEVKPHGDHNAKHGGTFFMAPDQKHHLEGAISDKGEFRVYFYDEYTKPIAADGFTAEGSARTKGKDLRKKFKLATEPGKAFLTGSVDASITFPIEIKIFIDFKDGKEPQVFDFDFDEASKPPTTHTGDEKHDKAVDHGRHKSEHSGHHMP